MTVPATFRRVGATAIAAGLVAAPMALAPQAAFATGTCAQTTPTATLVAPGVCEIVFDEDGTLSGISGINKLTAVLVGGGGGGRAAGTSYGGGGGEVVYIDDIDTSSDYTVEIGNGGIGNGEYDGSATVLTGDSLTYMASGGYGSNSGGGTSGSDLNGGQSFCSWGDAGAGAGDSAPGDGNTGGAGTNSFDIEGVDTALYTEDLEYGPFGSGGDSCIDELDGIAQHRGDGGAAGNMEAAGGADGLVIVRFAADSDDATELAATGAGSGIGGFAAGAALLAAAGALLLRRVR